MSPAPGVPVHLQVTVWRRTIGAPALAMHKAIRKLPSTYCSVCQPKYGRS